MGFVRLLLLLAVAYLLYRVIAGWLRQGDARARSRGPVAGTEGPPLSAHQVLGVAADASPEEIRSAYQRLIRQYHPDRVADMGPEIRALAEKRAKEINAAYEQLCKS
jgi:DnaJ-class molecular chaperone